MVLEFLHRISDKIIEMDVNNHHVRTILTIGWFSVWYWSMIYYVHFKFETNDTSIFSRNESEQNSIHNFISFKPIFLENLNLPNDKPIRY